jgi:hypothetical protein
MDFYFCYTFLMSDTPNLGIVEHDDSLRLYIQRLATCAWVNSGWETIEKISTDCIYLDLDNRRAHASNNAIMAVLPIPHEWNIYGISTILVPAYPVTKMKRLETPESRWAIFGNGRETKIERRATTVFDDYILTFTSTNKYHLGRRQECVLVPERIRELLPPRTSHVTFDWRSFKRYYDAAPKDAEHSCITFQDDRLVLGPDDPTKLRINAKSFMRLCGVIFYRYQLDDIVTMAYLDHPTRVYPILINTTHPDRWGMMMPEYRDKECGDRGGAETWELVPRRFPRKQAPQVREQYNGE